MDRIDGQDKHYAWGSRTALYDVLGRPREDQPLAEVWFSAYPHAPSPISDTGIGLDSYINADPTGCLGRSVVERFGPRLPYLLKLLAPDKPLSLQVHPGTARAREMFEWENAHGIAFSDPTRRYFDPNHKPELIYALSRFEAVVGFRAPRRIIEILRDLPAPLAQDITATLRQNPGEMGIRKVVERVLHPDTGPSAAQVEEVVTQCAQRVEAGTSPSLRADRTVMRLGRAYPGDVGAVLTALMNPVTLRPGEVLFIPTGGIHAYLSGCAVEIMAASDNVLRAGLTDKYIDCAELLECLRYDAAPPVRIAPEWVSETTQVFYAPVDDFELSVTQVTDLPQVVPGRGGRVILCVEGQLTLQDKVTSGLELTQGQAVFVRADQGPVVAQGKGRIMQADIP